MSDFLLSLVRAFLVGGLLCLPAQILIDKTKLTPARILVIYVCMGVVLGGIGLYEPLAKFAGCGATVPLTGFGYAIARGVKEAVNESGIAGAITGPLTAASGGTAAALLFGFLASLLFRGHPK